MANGQFQARASKEALEKLQPIEIQADESELSLSRQDPWQQAWEQPRAGGHPGHLELWAAELAGRYQLNTKAADALEAQVLKEWERARGHMQPLRGRYNQLYGQILEDVTADIAQAGREAGLMVILDKNQADIQAADITNQVLDILQGEA